MSLHPATTHFPIALLVASFVFDLIGVVLKDESFRKAGLYTLVLAALGAGASYLTGIQAAEEAARVPNIADSLSQHRESAVLTLVMTGTLLVGRMVVESRASLHRIGRVAYLLAALVSVVNVVRTGYLGSDLVQRHGAGVVPVMRHLQPADGGDKH